MYCTIEDLIKETDKNLLIDLVNDENEPQENINLLDENDIRSQRIREQILNADEEINAYLRQRYKLPLTNVPSLLKSISKDITIYNLYKRRHRLDMPESIVNIYKDKVKLLEKIQNGMVRLGIEEDNQEKNNTFFKTNKKPEDRIFNIYDINN
jgi:phage gp36-like protein